MIRLSDLLGERIPNNGAYLTICVDGRGASGKTSLSDFLQAHLAGFEVVHGDDYFEPHHDPITWGDFNEARFDADVLSRMRVGDRTIPMRPFDFPNDRVGPERPVEIARGVVLERWLALGLNVSWDVRIWVETPAEVCLARGLAREGARVLRERARLAWETVWQPREERYIQSTAPLSKSDFVVDGTAPFDSQFEFEASSAPGRLGARF